MSRRWIGFFILCLSAYFFTQSESEQATVLAPEPSATAPSATIKKQIEKKSLAKTAREPASKKPGSPVSEKVRQLQAIRDLKACYETQTCEFDDSDPRAYEIALGKELAAKLKAFRLAFGDDRALIQSLAQEFIASGDGFIQEEALNMFSSLPISEESLNAITENLALSPDPSLVKQMLPELQRYLGSAMEPKVHGFLSGTMATGAHFSSQTVSENISPFLSPQSYTTYKKTLGTMTPGASATRNLNSALREYRRVRTGA